MIDGGALIAGRAATAKVATTGDSVRFTFEGNRGDHVTFDVAASSWQPGYAYLRFYDPEGTQAGSCPLGSTPTYDDFTLTATGTWVVVVQPYGEALGSVTFTYAPDQDNGVLRYGRARARTTVIALRGQRAACTFAGTRGAHVTFDVLSSDWGTGYAYLRLYDPAGTLVESCLLESGPTFRDLTIATTGTWRAVIEPSAGAVGTVTFLVGADQNNGALVPHATTTTAIGYHGQRAVHSFVGNEGAHVAFDVASSTWSGGYADLRILDPAGTMVVSCLLDSVATHCDLTLGTTGTWKAMVAPHRGAVGEVNFTYAPDLDRGSLKPVTPTTATVTHPGQRVAYTFVGGTGTHVSFDVTASDWGDGYAHLRFYAPTGELVSSCPLGHGPTYWDFTLSSSGAWRAVVEPSPGSAGAVTFGYAPDQSHGPLVSGIARRVSIDLRGQRATTAFTGAGGGTATFEVTGSDWGPGGYAYLRFYDPSNTLVTSCRLAGSPKICTVPLSTGGSWRLVVEPHRGSVGSVTFRPSFG